MEHQGTKVEKEVVVKDNEATEVVRRQSSAYEPSDAERSMGRLERTRSIGEL